MLSYLYTLDYDDGWDPKMKKATEDEIARGFYRMTLGAPCDSKEGMHPSFDAQAPWEAPEEDEKIGPTAPSDPNNADEPAEEKAADHSREALDISAVKMAAALHDNILVFAIAHKYGVAELKVLAQEKFSARAEIFWSISQACGLSIWHTCGLVKAVYETTPEGERGLRDVVVLLCSKYTNSLMAMEDFRTMTLEVNSFASDLLLKTAASAEEARIEHGKKVELVRDLLRDRQTKILEGQDRSLELAKRLESAEAAFRRTMNIIARYEKCRHCDEVFRPHPEFHLASNFKVLRCSSCNTRHHEGKSYEGSLSWQLPSPSNAIGHIINSR